MVTKLSKATATSKTPRSKTTTSKKASIPLAGSVKDSAQQIWQAGLGAFTKAQTEGTKAFEALVKEGVSFQRKTQSAAEEKINEATQKMTSMATDISSKASGQWDKLESIFEDRVAKALNKLGVPSAKDVSALIARIDELNASVQKLTPKPLAKSPVKSASKAPVTAVAPEVVAVMPAAKKRVVKKTSAPKAATPKAVAPSDQVNPE
ncbi:MAG: phasin family protein [Rhodoferax sp.]|jgi:poly(hydroxyalkanoate) granule-associated protein|uniref:phasin family protein n=1 Tax=Rhodoferax sp. TaxID=50421 RepID=UPI001B5615F0|nr:phasin family protein [Rhodoferax sp.]MBP9150608.1 phasin family protein [Rhodoferax sp.]MBP9737717.1 phasin family protein [Rhodoferax sp.]